MNDPLCAIIGVGPGNGASFARVFSREGYRTALIARRTDYSESLARERDNARAYGCDITDPVQVNRAFDSIREELGEPDVVIYNAGQGVWGCLDEITAEGFEQSWQTNARGAFLTAKEVVPAMKVRGAGQLIFVGATASWRGKPKTTAFAAAKAAQRSLAESLARDLGPHGIHVSLIIPDGVIGRPDKGTDPEHPDKIDPDAVAETALTLINQPRSAWTFEIAVRPCVESW